MNSNHEEDGDLTGMRSDDQPFSPSLIRFHLDFLPKPEELPKDWRALSKEEKAMIIWFRHDIGTLRMIKIARHAIACRIYENGGFISGVEATKIWDALINPSSEVIEL